MKFQVLASGSKGNATLVKTNTTTILIDTGICADDILNKSGVDVKDIDAILITHDHGDHTKFLQTILKHSKAVLYIHKDTFDYLVENRKMKFVNQDVQFIENNKKYLIGDIAVFTMALSHDTVNCNGFIFANGSESMAYIADTGIVPLIYMEVLKKVDTLLIEANHDIEMLNESDRPWILKNRILSFKGHLSNIMCGEIVNKLLDNKKINKIILLHLSEECNRETLAIDTVMSEIKGDYIPLIKASRQYEALEEMDVK